jgi:hypothetical protein
LWRPWIPGHGPGPGAARGASFEGFAEYLRQGGEAFLAVEDAGGVHLAEVALGGLPSGLRLAGVQVASLTAMTPRARVHTPGRRRRASAKRRVFLLASARSRKSGDRMNRILKDEQD